MDLGSRESEITYAQDVLIHIYLKEIISFHSIINRIPFGVGLILQQDASQYTCMQIHMYGTCRVSHGNAILLKDVGNDFESKAI